MAAHNRKGRSKSGPKFIQLFHVVKRSARYHGLSVNARCALLELLDRYDGRNNGKIGLGVRELAYELNCSPATACRALRELDDAGLAQPTVIGVWRGKQASQWRLTFYRDDRTGDLPKRNLKPRPSFTSENQSCTSENDNASEFHG